MYGVMKYRICKKCNLKLPLDKLVKKSNMKYSRRNECKKCYNKRINEYRFGNNKYNKRRRDIYHMKKNSNYIPKITPKCNVLKCRNTHSSRGYCKKHYEWIYGILQNQKQKVYKYYGGKCITCNEDDLDVLHLDHINNDGHLERDNKGRRKSINYSTILKWIINTDKKLKKYQILCANCNQKKRLFYTSLKKLEELQIPPF